MNLPDLITDRTEADVEKVRTLANKGSKTWTAAERAEWLNGLKGSYNASDLNRVGSAVDYVAQRLKSCGVTVKVAPKTDWQEIDIPSKQDMDSYLADIVTLRGALSLWSNAPQAPVSMQKLTWEEANAIESILLAVDETITRMSQAWFYSGDLYAGEA